MTPVPDSWSLAQFADVVDVISDGGRRVDARDYITDGPIPVVDQGEGLVGGYTLDADSAYDGPLPVIVFGDHTRRLKFVDFRFAIGAQGVKLLRPKGDLDCKYLYWVLRSSDIPSRGYARHFSLLRKQVIPVAPEAEQRRIVDAIEEQFSRLDATSDLLDKARKRLALLDRLMLDAVGLGAWERLPVGALAEVQGGIQKQPKRRPILNKYPFLRVANVHRGSLDLTDVHEVELFGDELTRYRLKRGDLLVVEGNGSRSQIGRSALWDGSIDPCVHQNHLIRVRPGPRLLPEYLNACWNSAAVLPQIYNVASSTSGLYTLSTAKVRAILIPLPPIDEQSRLVDLQQEQGTSIDALQMQLLMAQQRSDRLRQATLRDAFAGPLVNALSTRTAVA